MNDIVISFDDMWEGNDRWNDFINLHKKIPNIKITFFVNPSQCSIEFLKKINQSWIELVYHAENHSGGHKKWSKEEAKERLLKYVKEFNFAKGFKAPGWKITQNIIDGCKELDFWIASINTIPIEYNKVFYTYYKKGEGLSHHEKYSEYYGHLQSYNFIENLKELKEYCTKKDLNFKFVSEMI